MRLQQYYDALQQYYDVIRFNVSDNVSDDIVLMYFGSYNFQLYYTALN